jgi:hypothetical protein
MYFEVPLNLRSCKAGAMRDHMGQFGVVQTYAGEDAVHAVRRAKLLNGSLCRYVVFGAS